MPHSLAQHPGCGRLVRRHFLALSAGSVMAGAAAPTRAASGRPIRVGLIGCGGRGTGAALQAAHADPEVRIVALADYFPDQIESAALLLGRDAAPSFDCPHGRRFAGEDAHRRLLDSGVDAVVIAAPPHLRPLHVEAAIAAGAHVFCETPAAIDGAGALRVVDALAVGRAAGLVIAAGLHARRDPLLQSVVESVRGGSIGTLHAVSLRPAAGATWRVPAQPGWTEAEGRLRNWVSWPALSGGVFVERHVHALDRALWALGDRPPVVARPLGTAGDAVSYRFADDSEIRIAVHGQPRGAGSETVVGERGTVVLRLAADGRRFQATMDRFVGAIRARRSLPDGEMLVRATLVAVMGRRAAATGRSVAWTDLPRADTPTSPAPHGIAGPRTPENVDLPRA